MLSMFLSCDWIQYQWAAMKLPWCMVVWRFGVKNVCTSESGQASTRWARWSRTCTPQYPWIKRIRQAYKHNWTTWRLPLEGLCPLRWIVFVWNLRTWDCRHHVFNIQQQELFPWTFSTLFNHHVDWHGWSYLSSTPNPVKFVGYSAHCRYQKFRQVWFMTGVRHLLFCVWSGTLCARKHAESESVNRVYFYRVTTQLRGVSHVD